MPVGLQYIRRRIKSIKNTRQVTKAMEAIAATKMRKATAKALASKEYALFAQELIQNLSTQEFAQDHPLMKEQGGEKILMLLITSNRGLCGGLNTKILQEVNLYFGLTGRANLYIVCLGKKGQEALRRVRKTPIAVFDLGENPTSLEIRPIAHFLMNEYVAKSYKKVVIAFTDFQSLMRQKPVIKQLLPLSYEIEDTVGRKNNNTEFKDQRSASLQKMNNVEYLIEPNSKTLLEIIIPRYVETQVYQTILEALASEHVARMFAMRNATDNATEIIHDLSLTYNQARQALITQEIAEISAGKAALT